jgi:hypothetical protein
MFVTVTLNGLEGPTAARDRPTGHGDAAGVAGGTGEAQAITRAHSRAAAMVFIIR